MGTVTVGEQCVAIFGSEGNGCSGKRQKVRRPFLFFTVQETWQWVVNKALAYPRRLGDGLGVSLSSGAGSYDTVGICSSEGECCAVALRV